MDSNGVLPQEPVDRLPTHLNTVLIQIGRLFQHSVRTDPKLYNRPKSTAIDTLSKANRQFHEALDGIEIELLNAKSVLERDLTVLRAKRAERENALRVERLKAAGKDAAGGKGDLDKHHSRDAQMNDVTTSNIGILSKSEMQPRSAELGNENTHNTDMIGNTIGNGNSLGGPGSGGSLNNQAAQAAADSGNPQELKDLGMTGDIFVDGLGPSGFNNISTSTDFDSMFKDSVGNSTDALNFDLDFSAGPGISDGQIAVTGPGALSSAAEAGILDASSSEDITSLLPGLENLVDADGDGAIDDFAMIDVPMENGALNVAPASEAQQASNATENIGPSNTVGQTSSNDIDASYDDLFGTDGFDMGDAGDINNGDFDDFFNS